jgi:hypothetical protein
MAAFPSEPAKVWQNLGLAPGSTPMFFAPFPKASHHRLNMFFPGLLLVTSRWLGWSIWTILGLPPGKHTKSYWTHSHRNLVDFPSYKMVDLSIVTLVTTASRRCWTAVDCWGKDSTVRAFRWRRRWSMGWFTMIQAGNWDVTPMRIWKKYDYILWLLWLL